MIEVANVQYSQSPIALPQMRQLKDGFGLQSIPLTRQMRRLSHFDEIVGESEALRRILEEIETVASTDSTVLIYGETGTGKELIARALHNLSPRKSRALVKFNCAAFPTGLLESELFGHEKGAFTGAIAQRVGRFELAHGGTIFLAEFGEIPLELQPKLLRFVQEREFERLGSTRTIHTNARLVAATNRDLKSMVEEQQFRSDLYYRLNVFPIRVPALRERPEDIPLLVWHFVEEFSRRNGRAIESIPSQTMKALVHYDWPGNIRELQNVIERSVIRSKGPVLTVDIAQLDLCTGTKGSHSLDDMLQEAERTLILRSLELANWVVAGKNGAAARLRINRSTLMSRMQRLGIRVSRNCAVSNQPEANGERRRFNTKH